MKGSFYNVFTRDFKPIPRLFCLFPAISHFIVLPHKIAEVQYFEISLGTCPTTSLSFKTFTTHLSWWFSGSAVVDNFSPKVGTQISLYTWWPVAWLWNSKIWEIQTNVLAIIYRSNILEFQDTKVFLQIRRMKNFTTFEFECVEKSKG